MKRSSGILLHPTSMPGPYGIGELGEQSYRFIDWLESAGQRIWQVLPLGPTGYGDSPYSSFSTFAGNPLLVSLDRLQGEGYIEAEDLVDSPANEPDAIDYGSLIPWKMEKLRLAAASFLETAPNDEIRRFEAFLSEERDWLDDYALFMDIKEAYDKKAMAEGRHGAMWSNYWPQELALKDDRALEEWKASPVHAVTMRIRKVIQYFFFVQWRALKSYANEKDIEIVGDLPIFVAADSVDVWAHRELFQLDKTGQPLSVAGVPPDYFSATGQLWGNPLYDWNRHEHEHFKWWTGRIARNLRLFDWLRIDHFRGFEAYWAVPFGAPTAERGHWEKAPGHKFFRTLKRKLGDLPILAEDLGFITEEVRDLRDSYGLPGMKILQFAFDAAESGKGLDSQNAFLPHMYTPRCVVYTGTHDNDTLAGWISKAEPEELDFIRSYLGYTPADYVEALVRLAFASVADFSIIPMQDALGLGDESRMNTPSTLGSNWKWRLEAFQLTEEVAVKLKSLSKLYAREGSD